MDDNRREQLRQRLYQETNDQETQEWRDDLTPEELEYVNQIDDQYIPGIAAICSAILVRDLVRSRFPREEIAELETIWDHCRLRLRDGSLYLARLGRDNRLRLDEIDEVC